MPASTKASSPSQRPHNALCNSARLARKEQTFCGGGAKGVRSPKKKGEPGHGQGVFESVPQANKDRFTKFFSTLNPAKLRREVVKLTSELYCVSNKQTESRQAKSCPTDKKWTVPILSCRKNHCVRLHARRQKEAPTHSQVTGASNRIAHPGLAGTVFAYSTTD
jgi:hypothetical protein